MTLQTQQGGRLCSTPELDSSEEMGLGPTLYPLPSTSLT